MAFKILAILVVLFIIYVILGWDYKLNKRQYYLKSNKVDKPVRLMVISDLHCCKYGEKQNILIKAIENCRPGAILFAGDIIDDTMPYDGTIELLEGIKNKYMCYYVTGNHEFRRGAGEIKEMFRSYNVTVLEGSNDILEINGQLINICGVDDPDGVLDYNEQLDNAFDGINTGNYTVLIAHRPELIETYKEYNCDLVVSGHAHGGQWRIPHLMNGLIAPQQGIFPKYAGGIYKYNKITHIVSRGLAKESVPVPRLFNPPELVVIDILPGREI